MSRTTTLQLIAAAITIAVLVALHQGLDWALSMTSTDFMVGILVGAAVVMFVWYLAEREGRHSRSADSGSSTHQESARHSIDL